ncbi:hypothetical protein DYD21_04470 [Rhodohalobacter sp. SW132]|uniref:hypothetical protein n=1 Tax=Rhodohalobacter sp. SW132 TaxID=2293433 RepID=UPI000E2678BB|nr:hypothetical protein [Rhodohalobacter sp. SW132]REL39214.1 hypothetical protein DYD21_04470 [Rhodohalobacter sp. SW132]
MQVEITTDLKLKTFYRSGLILLFFLITILLSLQNINRPIFGFYLPDLVTGLLSGLATGAFVAGLFSPRFPVIVLDEDGISTKNSLWDQSAKWDRLRNLSLHTNKIVITYNQTGASDTIRIPWLLQKKLDEIDEAISHFSSLHNLQYYSKRTI